MQTRTRKEEATGVRKTAGEAERGGETEGRTKTENDGTARGIGHGIFSLQIYSDKIMKSLKRFVIVGQYLCL